jgi:hypothetical protein
MNSQESQAVVEGDSSGIRLATERSALTYVRSQWHRQSGCFGFVAEAVVKVASWLIGLR